MRLRSRFRVRAGIPSASMADLALLLLIFFMTTTFFQVERGPVLSLPTASQGQERSRENAVMLRVDAAGVLYWEGRRQSLAGLAQRLEKEQSRRTVERVFLYADASTEFENVFPVLQGLRGVSPVPLVLAVEPESRATRNRREEDPK